MLIPYAGASDIPEGTMRVRLEGTLDLASIYQDPLGTPKANPFVTDPSNGAYTFWAEDDATYDVEEINADGSDPEE